jgi:hypothetical protein
MYIFLGTLYAALDLTHTNTLTTITGSFSSVFLKYCSETNAVHCHKHEILHSMQYSGTSFHRSRYFPACIVPSFSRINR